MKLIILIIALFGSALAILPKSIPDVGISNLTGVIPEVASHIPFGEGIKKYYAPCIEKFSGKTPEDCGNSIGSYMTLIANELDRVENQYVEGHCLESIEGIIDLITKGADVLRQVKNFDDKQNCLCFFLVQFAVVAEGTASTVALDIASKIPPVPAFTSNSTEASLGNLKIAINDFTEAFNAICEKFKISKNACDIGSGICIINTLIGELSDALEDSRCLDVKVVYEQIFQFFLFIDEIVVKGIDNIVPANPLTFIGVCSS